MCRPQTYTETGLLGMDSSVVLWSGADLRNMLRFVLAGYVMILTGRGL